LGRRGKQASARVRVLDSRRRWLETVGGAELRFLCMETDLSQEDLGALIDRDRQSIARWEKGRTKVDPAGGRILRALCKGVVGGRLRAFLTKLQNLEAAPPAQKIVVSERKNAWTAKAAAAWHGQFCRSRNFLGAVASLQLRVTHTCITESRDHNGYQKRVAMTTLTVAERGQEERRQSDLFHLKVALKTPFSLGHPRAERLER
jgi:transcriptional regulator with XRE-family HTH domain